MKVKFIKLTDEDDENYTMFINPQRITLLRDSSDGGTYVDLGGKAVYVKETKDQVINLIVEASGAGGL